MEAQKKIRTVTIGRSLLAILLAGIFALGVFIGRGTWLFSPAGEREEADFARESSEEFRFIRQSIPQDGTTDTRKAPELKPFRYKVAALIDARSRQGDLSSASVYFRDLDNGNWFGINDQEPFSPENQLKIPLMIAYFKRAEENPLVLRKKLTALPSQDAADQPDLLPSRTLEPGKSYSVNDLIFRMIAYNDNDAYALLAANLPRKFQQKIYKELYVNYDPRKKNDLFSLSAYASFFRVLFNASYLSEEMSEKALRYLSRSSFRSGMVAAIPADVELASKAGERVLGSAGGTEGEELLQLHEFGIVYHPRRPFLLGITVRGADYDKLKTALRDITKLIYAEVDHQTHDLP